MSKFRSDKKVSPVAKKFRSKFLLSTVLVALAGLNLTAAPTSAATLSWSGTLDAASTTTKSALHTFALTAPSKIDAKITWSTTTAVLTIQLFAPNALSTPVAVTRTTTATSSSFTFDATKTGTWTIKAIALSGKSAYTLTETSGTTTSTTLPPTTTTTTTTLPPTTTTVPPPPPLVLNGLFPIGVAHCRPVDMAKWKSRNINTVVNVPKGIDATAWIAEANRLGLYKIHKPSANLAADKTEPRLLAWTQPDESDGVLKQIPWEEMQQRYAAMKAADPNRLVFINFTGGLNQHDVRLPKPKLYGGDAWYAEYAKAGDLISADTYPVNWGYNMDTAGQGPMIDHLEKIAPSKPTFAFIETGDIDKTDANPGPTPSQVRGQVWDAVIHGARGINYFPLTPVAPGFTWDNTPPGVATEITKQNGTLAQLAPVLQGPINPTAIGATVPAPLEVGWRNAPSGKYFFVLNLSNTQKNGQKVTLSGTGTKTSATVYGEARSESISSTHVITDDFAPYSIHIYQVK